MTDTVLQSFCERCGTRFTVELPQQKPEPPPSVLGRFKRKSPQTIDDSGFPPEYPASEHFKGTFHFCLECRRYNCPECWNEQDGYCVSCRPPGATLDEGPTSVSLAAAAHLSHGDPAGGSTTWQADHAVRQPSGPDENGHQNEQVDLDEWGRPRTAQPVAKAELSTDPSPWQGRTDEDPWRGVVFSADRPGPDPADRTPASEDVAEQPWPSVDAPVASDPGLGREPAGWPDGDRKLEGLEEDGPPPGLAAADAHVDAADWARASASVVGMGSAITATPSQEPDALLETEQAELPDAEDAEAPASDEHAAARAEAEASDWPNEGSESAAEHHEAMRSAAAVIAAAEMADEADADEQAEAEALAEEQAGAEELEAEAVAEEQAGAEELEAEALAEEQAGAEELEAEAVAEEQAGAEELEAEALAEEQAGAEELEAEAVAEEQAGAEELEAEAVAEEQAGAEELEAEAVAEEQAGAEELEAEAVAEEQAGAEEHGDRDERLLATTLVARQARDDLDDDFAEIEARSDAVEAEAADDDVDAEADADELEAEMTAETEAEAEADELEAAAAADNQAEAADDRDAPLLATALLARQAHDDVDDDFAVIEARADAVEAEAADDDVDAEAVADAEAIGLQAEADVELGVEAVAEEQAEAEAADDDLDAEAEAEAVAEVAEPTDAGDRDAALLATAVVAQQPVDIDAMAEAVGAEATADAEDLAADVGPLEAPSDDAWVGAAPTEAETEGPRHVPLAAVVAAATLEGAQGHREDAEDEAADELGEVAAAAESVELDRAPEPLPEAAAEPQSLEELPPIWSSEPPLPQAPLAPAAPPRGLEVWSVPPEPGPFAQPYQLPAATTSPLMASAPTQPGPASAPPMAGQQVVGGAFVASSLSEDAAPQPPMPTPTYAPPPAPTYASPPPFVPPPPQQMVAPSAYFQPLPPPRQQATTRACPNCALPISTKARFCRRCGTPQPG